MDLDRVTTVEAFGLLLPVQNARDLIHYKRKIACEEAKHLSDVKEILRGRSSRANIVPDPTCP
jgi:hypothetical protein